MKVVIINRKQEQRLFKVKRNICCRYTVEKYILFSCLDILVLNTIKKKYFFPIHILQILSTTKINPREITEIGPSVKINPRKKF